MNASFRPITLNVAGKTHVVQAAPGRRLSEVLREELDLRSVKVGCDAGDCGACTVLIDGAQHCACLTPVAQAHGREIETLETAEPRLSQRLQDSFLTHGAAQCGICTPGIMMAAMELLRTTPRPNRTQVEDALGGVLCRCTGYVKIITAVMETNRNPVAPVAPNAGQAVGASIPRVDGRRKVDGSERFGADTPEADALLVRAVRSAFFSADFSFGDLTSWAAQTHGVEAVITAKDIKGINAFGVIPPLADQPALAQTHTRFLGEPVALVVGAAEAIEALDLTAFPVTWTERASTVTQAQAMQSDAPQVHEARGENTLIRGRVTTGDPDAALTQAAFVAQGAFETSYVEHAYIEPEAGRAWLCLLYTSDAADELTRLGAPRATLL